MGMIKIIGQCTGGLSCNGGCCRNITYNADGSVEHGYCQHYQKETGKCGIYDRRAELGFTGCITFPMIDAALRNGLPNGCGYQLVDDGSA